MRVRGPKRDATQSCSPTALIYGLSDSIPKIATRKNASKRTTSDHCTAEVRIRHDDIGFVEVGGDFAPDLLVCLEMLHEPELSASCRRHDDVQCFADGLAVHDDVQSGMGLPRTKFAPVYDDDALDAAVELGEKRPTNSPSVIRPNGYDQARPCRRLTASAVKVLGCTRILSQHVPPSHADDLHSI